MKTVLEFKTSKPTVKVRQRRVILVFHKHITEFDLGTIHVLASNYQLQHSSALSLSIAQDVSHLCR
jgi:hypothetical protein